jgi:hypothetical protein
MSRSVPYQPQQQYRVHFVPGSSGRFIMTILYGLLVDPVYINYSNNSAHEFQSKKFGSFFYYTNNIWSSWHALPKEFLPDIKYIIISINSKDLEEIASNNFQKNIIENIVHGEREIVDLNKFVDIKSTGYNQWTWGNFTDFAKPMFDTIYQEAMGATWTKGSIDNISSEEQRSMEDVIYRWMYSDSVTCNFIDYTNHNTDNLMVINYSDIFSPSGDNSWRVLDQLIEHTRVSHVDAQVRDNYKRYVDQRNKQIESR